MITPRPRAPVSNLTNLAALADFLTASRLILAVVIFAAAWSRAFTVAGVVVATAWLTDLADGRLARRSGVATRLGTFDLAADTAVGTGLLIGLSGAGTVPPWAAATAVVVLGVWFATGNIAASYLLQLAGYLPLLLLLWWERPPLWWLPMTTAAVIGVVDWRRLVTVNIPNFVRGVAGQCNR